MSDIVEFNLELKDITGSSGMMAFANTSQNALSNVSNSLSGVQNKLNDLGRPVKLNVDSKSLDSAQASIDRTNEKMSLLKASTGMFLGSLGSQLVMKGAGEVMSLGKNVLTSGMEAGATKMQFGVLAGEHEGAQLYNELRKYVQESIFGPELYQNAKQMMAFGIAAKDVMPTMKMLGDVSMGDKGRMDQLTLAFSQTTSAGKLMGQDLLQYIAAGFNPLSEIAQKTGKSMATLRDEMSEGKISALMVRDAFIQATSEGGKFHGMLDKMSQTPFGKWQAIQGSIQDSIMSLGTSLDSPLNKLFDDMQKDVEKLPELIQRIAPVADHLLITFEELYKWTGKNSESIGNFFVLVKIGAEAYAAWKIGTVALTAANWLLMESVGATASGAIAATTEEQLLTAAVLEQTEAVELNQLAWLSMSKAQLAALDAAAVGIAANPIVNATSAVAAGNTATAVAAGSIAGIVSRGALQVGIVWMAGEVLQQLFPSLQDGIGYDENGKPLDVWDIAGKNEAKKRRAELERNMDAWYSHPSNATRSPADVADMFNSRIDLRSLGVQVPFADPYGLKPGKDSQTNKTVTDATNNITSGGRKQIIINVNKSFVENFTINAKEVKEGYGQIKEMVGQAFLEVLNSADSVNG